MTFTSKSIKQYKGKMYQLTYSVNGYEHTQVGIIKKITSTAFNFEPNGYEESFPLTYEQLIEISEPIK